MRVRKANFEQFAHCALLALAGALHAAHTLYTTCNSGANPAASKETLHIRAEVRHPPECEFDSLVLSFLDNLR